MNIKNVALRLIGSNAYAKKSPIFCKDFIFRIYYVLL